MCTCFIEVQDFQMKKLIKTYITIIRGIDKLKTDIHKKG
ncbi:hypothetical protein J2Z44_003798 [Clostridium punense]|uniref:Uncharacterized protein n=1 Tax=Clostridium punense TaxID=1054297 RepID=A0ABS4K843_9CLOT|nr:hypothetical protein M918_20645 [Clostridium sp. BL8]MBP2023953.1 hypothetical protein [Clostridium punense]